MSSNLAYLQAHHLLPKNQDQFSGQQLHTQSQPQGERKRHPFHVERIKIPDAEYINEVPEHLQNQEIPGFPSTVAIIGKPGSGKTNLTMNLLLKPVFWKGFFDKIYLLGPTVKTDKLFKQIKVPEDQIVADPKEFIRKLVEWTNKQKEAVENDPATAPKCLFFFEDITAYRHTVQNDPEFVKCFTTIRHHKSTALVNFHKYTALERTARINCMHICIFPVNRTDLEHVYKEYASTSMDLDDFHVMCRFAWKPDEENKKPFLYINMYSDDSKRFRKCFTNIIDTSHFEGIGKYLKAKRKEKFDAMFNDEETETPKNSKVKKSKRKFSEVKGNPILDSLDTSIKKDMGDMTKPPSEIKIKQQNEEGWENSAGPFKKKRSVRDNVFSYLK